MAKEKTLALHTLNEKYIGPILQQCGYYIGDDGYIRVQGNPEAGVKYEGKILKSPRTAEDYIKILDSQNLEVFSPFINHAHMLHIVCELLRQHLVYLHYVPEPVDGFIIDDEDIEYDDPEAEIAKANLIQIKQYRDLKRQTVQFELNKGEDEENKVLGSGYDPLFRDNISFWMACASTYININKIIKEKEFADLEASALMIEKLLKKSEREYKKMKEAMSTRTTSIVGVNVSGEESEEPEMMDEKPTVQELHGDEIGKNGNSLFSYMNYDSADDHPSTERAKNVTNTITDPTSTFMGVTLLPD